jgi:hypothetical protein
MQQIPLHSGHLRESRAVPHEQKCCGMTKFDGIRCQELPLNITSSFPNVFTTMRLSEPKEAE